MLRRLYLAAALLAASTCAWGDSLTASNYSPVRSVTGQIGDVQLPTVCGNQASSPIGGTSAETAFSTYCVIPANTIKPNSVAQLHVDGVYTAAATNGATGKVHFTNSPTFAPSTDGTLVNTTNLNGIAGATNALWWGDVWVTFQTSSMKANAKLFFQAATNVDVPLQNGNSYTIDPTKDLYIYLTVTWSTASTGNSMTLSTMAIK